MWKILSDNYYSYMQNNECLINLKRAKNCWIAEIKVRDKWELHDIKEMGLDSAKKLCLSIMEGN